MIQEWLCPILIRARDELLSLMLGQMYTHKGDYVSSGDSGQEQVGRNLSDDIANRPQCGSSHQFISVHSQILLHPAHEGVLHIRLIDVFQKVAQLYGQHCLL